MKIEPLSRIERLEVGEHLEHVVEWQLTEPGAVADVVDTLDRIRQHLPG